jgi:hypothetical protein
MSTNSNNKYVQNKYSGRVTKRLGNIPNLPGNAIYYFNNKKNKLSSVKRNTLQYFVPNLQNFIYFTRGSKLSPFPNAMTPSNSKTVINVLRARLNKNGGTIIFV